VNHQPIEILKKYWGFDHFRPLQQDIIESVISGNDTLAILPTGGGKSICFQVPALSMEGLCLVISPLIALMKDQWENLIKRDIDALHIFTGMPYREIEETLKKAASGRYRFLYCSPERLQSNLFREYLPALPISLVAVDEAHCISQWGYDFRPSYLQIAKLREQKPGVPFLALTASATPEVRADIMLKLDFREQRMFAGSFARENLAYHVVDTDSRIHKCLDIVKRMKGSGLVYCKSRKRTVEIADLLKMEKVSAESYHAGLLQETRNERQAAWISGETRVIVCTNAFGMGIDKPDVRFVIHLDCPDSLENYYQEAGRAGRDGKTAHAVLLKTPTTITDLENLPDIRFPSIPVIRKVYQALGDYLQIAAGTGEENSFDFDLNEFVKRFRLNVFEAMYAIEAMDQEGILQLSEQIFIPSKLQFIADRKELEYVEQQNPQLELLTKTLLRTYGGIWDQPTSISERQLARIMKTDSAKVISSIHELHSIGIINYEPRKNNPQLRLLQNRVKAEDLYINPERYLGRKKAYITRVKAMCIYLEEKGTCRSKKICKYFGDKVLEDCGVCDSCRKKQKEVFSGEQFDKIVELLKIELAAGKNTPEEIQLCFPLERREYLKKVMSYLSAEGKLLINAEGRMSIM
jgi:ATP-dependent DNA helicase RecQ